METEKFWERLRSFYPAARTHLTSHLMRTANKQTESARARRLVVGTHFVMHGLEPLFANARLGATGAMMMPLLGFFSLNSVMRTSLTQSQHNCLLFALRGIRNMNSSFSRWQCKIHSWLGFFGSKFLQAIKTKSNNFGFISIGWFEILKATHDYKTNILLCKLCQTSQPFSLSSIFSTFRIYFIAVCCV
jgi:hypothetical protein